MEGCNNSTPHTSALDNRSVYQIPGFHYDHERNRYYRILPGPGNTVTGFVTQDSLRSKQAERDHKLQQNESDDLSSRQNIVAPYLSRLNHNIVQMTSNRQQSQLNRSYWRCCVLSGLIRRIGCFSSQAIPFESVQYELSHSGQLQLGSCENQLLCLWLVTHKMCGYQRNVVQRLNFECFQKKQDGHAVFSLQSVGYQSLSPNQISSLCWIGASAAEHYRVMYVSTTVQPSVKDVMSYVVIDPVDKESLATGVDESDLLPTRFKVGRCWTWACASNCVGSSVVVGTEKKSVLFDVETGCRFYLDTQKSDAMSEAFAKKSPNILYTGTRNGKIFCYQSCLRVYSLMHKSSVVSLKVSNDDQYLIAADLSGKLMKWDLRKNQIVTNYEGNVNTDAVFSTVGVDSNGNILYAVGSDGLTRLWDVKTGELLKVVIPPHPVTSVRALPSAIYSDTFGNVSYPGLILAVGSKLYFYAV